MLWPQKHDKSDAMPRVTLAGPSVTLTTPQLEHCKQWIEVRARNQTMLTPLEPVWPKNALTPDFYAKRLKRQAREWAQDSAYPFLIFENGSHDMIGGININHVCRGAAQYASLGYWLCQNYQRKGYMSEALQIICRFSFEKISLHRLNAAVLPDNQRSINLLIRNGFTEEGRAEKYIKIHGRWRDHILFGLPIEAWADNNKKIAPVKLTLTTK